MDLHKIKDRSRDRYHALAISSIWRLDRVRQLRALVVGAGALGNEVCKNLAMMGVKLIAIVDRDTVETANLTRSVFYRERDHGRPKAEVLAERVRELNPDVTVIPLEGDLESVLGLGLLRRMDLIFSCLDSRLARRNLNLMCQKLGCSWVDGAMEDLEGEVVAYVPGKTPCYECTLRPVDLEIIAEAKSCRGIALQSLAMGKIPTTSTMGSIVAAIQVQEALKILHGGWEHTLAGKRLAINCQTNDVLLMKIGEKPDCLGHTRFGKVTEVGEWTAATTTPAEILSRFGQDEGQPGELDLGREMVISLTCPECQKVTEFSELRYMVQESAAKCPVCNHLRVPETTHTVGAGEPFASWPLTRLGMPPLDAFQVRGPKSLRCYELTGDVINYGGALDEPAGCGSSAGME